MTAAIILVVLIVVAAALYFLVIRKSSVDGSGFKGVQDKSKAPMPPTPPQSGPVARTPTRRQTPTPTPTPTPATGLTNEPPVTGGTPPKTEPPA